jgi:hypothetical protein
MAKDPISELSNVNSQLKATNKQITLLEAGLKRISGLATTSFNTVKNVLSFNTGQTTGLNLGSSNANFGNAGGAGGGNAMPWAYSKTGAATIGGVQIGLGLAGAAYAALPSLSVTVPRATGFYQASRRTVGMNRSQLTSAAFSSMAGGISGTNEDMAAANVLTQGYNITDQASLKQSMAEVRGAALGYGIANATAAQAIGGLHTGEMGANLYQFGISTINAKTGQVRTTSDIAQQVYRKVYGNKKLTPEQLSFSMREGSLNRVINDLFTDPTQNQMMRLQMADISQGRNSNLLTMTGADNPLTNTAYKQFTSEASLANATTDASLAGYATAAEAMRQFNKALEGTPEAIIKLKGALEAASNSNMGSAANSAISGIASGLTTVAIGAGARKILGKMSAKSATDAISKIGGGAVTKAGATSMAGKIGLGAASKAVPVIGGVVSGMTGQGLVSSVATSAAVGGLFGGVPGALIAGGGTALGWIGTKIFQAFKSMSATSVSPGSGPNQTGMGLPNDADPQLVQTLLNAGFTGQSLVTAYGVAKAESGGRANAYNPTGMDDSYGLFQINMENNDPRNKNMGIKRNAAYLKKYKDIGYTGIESLKDPNINARIAYDMSKSGTNFKPWTTYTKGTYLNQLTPGGSTTGTGAQTVNINLTISKASEAEATAFAKKIKDILLKDKSLNAMGSK